MDGLLRAMWALIFVFSFVGLSLEDCPVHFLPVDGSCYFFSKGRATWQDAHWKCERMNSSLVAITHSEQDVSLRNVLNARKEGQFERWIGGIYDWKQAVWRWGATGQPIGYEGFAGNHRKNKLDWHCVILDPQFGNMWNSRKCTYKKHFVCQGKQTNSVVQDAPAFIQKKPKKKPKIYVCPENMIVLGNKCYKFSEEPSPWYEAHFKCGEHNASLAVIANRGQDLRLKRFLNKGFVEKHERWLGGLYNWKKKSWKWAMKGQPVRYQNFTPQLPTDPSALRWHCITIDPRVNNQWSSAECTDSRHYICQGKAKTVIKLGQRREMKRRKPDAEVIILADIDNRTLKSGIETKIYPRRRNNRKFTKTLHHDRTATPRSDYAEIIILNDQPQADSSDSRG